MKNKPIEQLATAVFDKGRRGAPRPGCDCVQCFGYCLVDDDEAERAGFRTITSPLAEEIEL